MRITRSTMLEVLREDCIHRVGQGPARHAGVWRHAQERLAAGGHADRHRVAFLIGGLIVTETVFNLPGVARCLVDAIQFRGYRSCRTWPCSSRWWWCSPTSRSICSTW
jgi:peptide/nickel transport system permease protein